MRRHTGGGTHRLSRELNFALMFKCLNNVRTGAQRENDDFQNESRASELPHNFGVQSYAVHPWECLPCPAASSISAAVHRSLHAAGTQLARVRESACARVRICGRCASTAPNSLSVAGKRQVWRPCSVAACNLQQQTLAPLLQSGKMSRGSLFLLPSLISVKCQNNFSNMCRSCSCCSGSPGRASVCQGMPAPCGVMPAGYTARPAKPAHSRSTSRTSQPEARLASAHLRSMTLGGLLGGGRAEVSQHKEATPPCKTPDNATHPPQSPTLSAV